MNILITTNLGDIIIEVDGEKAPLTVENFLGYIKEGFYNGTIFSRVIPGFMIQGGGFTRDLKLKETRASITNEADNGLKNVRGTLAMARKVDPHSAASEFFISLSDNDFLNFSGKSVQGWGYCVFGRVVEGLDVVDKIATVRTETRGQLSDVPTDPIVIESVKIIR